MISVLEGLTFPECPRWRRGRLYLSDFYTQTVWATSGDRSALPVVHLDDQPRGLGWLPSGEMLVVAAHSRTIQRVEANGRTHVHADLRRVTTGPLNDMVVDELGRAYVGSSDPDQPDDGRIIRVDPDGAAVIAARGLAYPNGAVLTADGCFVVAESFAGRLAAFVLSRSGDMEAAGNWATFGRSQLCSDATTAIARLEVVPDGICLDSAGMIWVADAGNRRVLRVAAGGTIIDEVRFFDGTYACALGGPDLRTLFVCAAGPPAAASATRRTGRLYAVPVAVPGLRNPDEPHPRPTPSGEASTSQTEDP